MSCALIGAGLIMLPWAGHLAATLPASATAQHWGATWAGLDVAEAIGLITTGVLAARADSRHALAATVTATLLTVDAWFDTMTATGANDRRLALELAIGGELPLAAFCARLAAQGLRRPRGTTTRGAR